MRSTLGVSAYCNDNVIQGNFIGTDATGTAALPNGASGNGGIILFFGQNNTIGGTTPGARNLISGNIGDGVVVEGDGITTSFKATSLAPMSPAVWLWEIRSEELSALVLPMVLTSSAEILLPRAMLFRVTTAESSWIAILTWYKGTSLGPI